MAHDYSLGLHRFRHNRHTGAVAVAVCGHAPSVSKQSYIESRTHYELYIMRISWLSGNCACIAGGGQITWWSRTLCSPNCLIGILSLQWQKPEKTRLVHDHSAERTSMTVVMATQRVKLSSSRDVVTTTKTLLKRLGYLLGWGWCTVGYLQWYFLITWIYQHDMLTENMMF